MTEFTVGGEVLVTADLTILRLKKMWPAVEALARGTVARIEQSTHLAQIVAASTERDEDRLEKTDIAVLGQEIERKMRVTELDGVSAGITDLLRSSGLGGAKSGEVPAASPSTETGTA